MSSFAFLLLCVQACLVQNVFSQSLGAGPTGYGAAPCGYGAPFGVAPMAAELGGVGAGMPPQAIQLGAYGGAGVGDVAVAGEMPVVGNTVVAGQVPILGSVRFNGELPASGTVTISGNCGCGCNNAPLYY